MSSQDFEGSQLSPEVRELISTLPKKEVLRAPDLYQYQGFWFPSLLFPGLISCQKNFHSQNSDIILVTNPKSGTTWLKAIAFALLNRQIHHPSAENHPLLTHNSHELVPTLEINQIQNPKIQTASPRLFSTHLPYSSLPESAKNSKFVYLYRDPKDMIVSIWHFTNKLRPQGVEEFAIGDIFEAFCEGLIWYGPFWDHVLEYWQKSKESPERVLFVKYEDLKEESGVNVRRVAGLAAFLGCGFSEEEEELGLAEGILGLCSFDRLSGLEVNRNGRVDKTGVENNAFFRRGVVGDWRNYLSAEMAEKLDRIIGEKFRGSGLF